LVRGRLILRSHRGKDQQGEEEEWKEWRQGEDDDKYDWKSDEDEQDEEKHGRYQSHYGRADKGHEGWNKKKNKEHVRPCTISVDLCCVSFHRAHVSG